MYNGLLNIKLLIVFGILILSISISIAEPRLAEERIILSTNYGDLVLALYPDVAPAHVAQIKKLVKLKAYNSTHFFRIEEGFIIQLSDVRNRRNALTKEQRKADQNIKAEFSDTLKHKKGTLSMARWEKENSATSSFSILLDDAPHLDGSYTIFGHLESGGSVVNRILRAPREGIKPISPIYVNRAWVEHDISKYYKTHELDSAIAITRQPLQNENIANTSKTDHKKENEQLWLIFPIVVMLILSTVAYLFSNKLSKSHLLSLHIVNILICVFVLFILTLPLGHQAPWLASVLFVLIYSMFRVMSRFENK